jgi:hypothetical protein
VIDDAVQYLSTNFIAQDMGDISAFLGIQVHKEVTTKQSP